MKKQTTLPRMSDSNLILLIQDLRSSSPNTQGKLQMAKIVGVEILRIIQFKRRLIKFLGGCDSKRSYFLIPVLLSVTNKQ